MTNYRIIESRGHGKACKGAKKTATFQVIEPHGSGYLVKAQFRYKIVDGFEGRETARLKANIKAAQLRLAELRKAK